MMFDSSLYDACRCVSVDAGDRGSRLLVRYYPRVYAGRPGHLVVGGAHLDGDLDGVREVGHGDRRDV